MALKTYIFPIITGLILITGLIMFPFAAHAEEGDDSTSNNRNKLQIQNLDMINKCKEEGLENEECSRMLNFAFTSMKGDLGKMLDGLNVKLERIVEKAVKDGSITQAEGDVLLDQYADLIEELKTEIDNAESIQDLQGFASRVKNDPEYQALFSSLMSMQSNHRYTSLENAIDRLNKFVARLDAHMEAASVAGADTTDLEEQLESVESDIEDLEILMRSVKSADSNISKVSFAEAKELFREIHLDLTEIVTSLKELYKVTPWEMPAHDE